MNMSYPLQTSSIDKWIDAPTRRVDAAGTTFVYRRIGPATGVPVILLNHWGAVLDNFDPRIVDGLAPTRPVIAVNYRGVGASGGKLISISGPPDPDFARDQGLNWFVRQVLRLLSFGIRRKAKRRRISYSFLFMRANGAQLSEITSLIETGIIRPVMDRVFPFEATNDALAYIEAGRSKGKVVVKVR